MGDYSRDAELLGVPDGAPTPACEPRHRTILAAQVLSSKQSKSTATMQRTLLLLLLGLAGMTGFSAAAQGPSLTDFAGTATRGEVVKFRGEVKEANDVSGAAKVGDFLLIVSEEVKHPTAVQVLKKDGAAYKIMHRFRNTGSSGVAVASDGRAIQYRESSRPTGGVFLEANGTA